jgi:hypothetical protein
MDVTSGFGYPNFFRVIVELRRVSPEFKHSQGESASGPRQAPTQLAAIEPILGLHTAVGAEIGLVPAQQAGKGEQETKGLGVFGRAPTR